jgi:hypothetical protein
MGDRQDLSKNLRPPWHPAKWENFGDLSFFLPIYGILLKMLDRWNAHDI